MYQKQTVRRMTPLMKKGAKIQNELESALRKHKNWLKKVQELEADHRLCMTPLQASNGTKIVGGRLLYTWPTCPQCKATLLAADDHEYMTCDDCNWTGKPEEKEDFAEKHSDLDTIDHHHDMGIKGLTSPFGDDHFA